MGKMCLCGSLCPFKMCEPILHGDQQASTALA